MICIEVISPGAFDSNHTSYLTKYTPKTFLRDTVILHFFYLGVLELYLFKVSEVIYAPSRPD